MKKKYKFLPLCILFTVITSCAHDLYIFHCKEANFSFSVLERDTVSIFKFGDRDSVFVTPACDGCYAGIEFYLLDSINPISYDSVNTIYFKLGLEFVQNFGPDSDSIVGRLVPPKPYKAVSHKYKFKYMRQDLQTLDYDYSVLGKNYWHFCGNVREHNSPFGFSYDNNDHCYGTMDVEMTSSQENIK